MNNCVHTGGADDQTHITLQATLMYTHINIYRKI